MRGRCLYGADLRDVIALCAGAVLAACVLCVAAGAAAWVVLR